ncbi:MAG TPA: TonB family protein [Spirochaetota bacterium]|nr:TonB family protein [Spirochaetota bacterium]
MSAVTAIPRRFARYLRLRPPLMWSLVSFVALLGLLFAVRWSESFDTKDFASFDAFEMVELRLSRLQTQADISVSDSAAPAREITEEKLEEFGSVDGSFEALSDSALPPRPVFGRLPRYPESMRKAGIEGVVVVELGVDESGTVVFGRIVKSLGRDFDAAVIDWARKISFRPALTKERVPIRCRIRLPIRFRLED